jgi:hypothetical protein
MLVVPPRHVGDLALITAQACNCLAGLRGNGVPTGLGLTQEPLWGLLAAPTALRAGGGSQWLSL